MTIKFEVGKTYSDRHDVDGEEYVSTYTIKSRTDKTVTVEMADGPTRKVVLRGLSIYKDTETFKPEAGAVVFADSEAKPSVTEPPPGRRREGR